ncbi:hypothetical protein [Streptomyces cupreus]|uniref:LysR substrate-binding domain-containing protein n=1 Tax=Streptomyces cupreus TaxID=2759956 RepID=A0A7X1JB17_9ACTN|nr:hypothetical protein [Streptomyces cupreus]MBC2906452.1 hypothetical protein [Streptomyces cupreus]
MEDCLLEVGRGHGVWFAPQPLHALMPAGNVRWIPVTDAEPFDLAVVWPDHAPAPLITRLIAEVRAVAGHDRQLHAA